MIDTLSTNEWLLLLMIALVFVLALLVFAEYVAVPFVRRWRQVLDEAEAMQTGARA